MLSYESLVGGVSDADFARHAESEWIPYWASETPPTDEMNSFENHKPHNMTPHRLAAFTLLAASTFCLTRSVIAAEPATAAQAEAMVDLETFPLPAGAERTQAPRLAELNYTTPEPTAAAAAYVVQLLTQQGCEKQPGGYAAGEYASEAFAKKGYVVQLAVSPGGQGKGTWVRLSHQGNVSPSDVPVPANAEKQHAFSAVAMYGSPASVEETVAACRERMLATGWSPYGEVIGTASYRKNAVVADLSIQAAPAQAGATVIGVSTHLVSLELPAPPSAINLRYTDGTTDLGFDCDRSADEVAAFYREALGPLGWRATTDKPLEIDWKLVTIFRDAGQQMITLATHDFEGKTRAFLNHQNADEVAEDERLASVELGRKATYQFKDRPTVDVKLLAGLEGAPTDEWAVKVDAKKHDPFLVADEVVSRLVSDGWTAAEHAADGPAIHVRRLYKDDRFIHVIAAKAPKRDPWVAIVGIGVNVRAM